ncbi:hypothetical protein CLOSTASPAR_03109 [[Clostridium] asparagiforme DSM 15981]|uniref:Uncharacterized protein n=1 Tax=[Clostridium] asparagiforme DSM 15981 TaxID=518636 RepID=C0D1H1_9FIRM|nr:hypothetical protein CLOSTASPAR_03109 [[Clostridium] asparagiforme DSM 15981]
MVIDKKQGSWYAQSGSENYVTCIMIEALETSDRNRTGVRR